MTRFALSVLLTLASASLARADAVEPAPEHCPPGSEGRSSHAGPVCAPTAECTDDANCGTGEHCAEISQCIDTRPCGGGWSPPDCTQENVMDVCDATTNCGGTATCRTRRVCQPAPEPPPAEPAPAAPPPAESSGGGCRAASGTGSHVVLALFALFALVLRARR